MTRIAIVVGCNTYESTTLSDLTSAELDARNVSEALENGTDTVLLLLSPTATAVQEAFAKIAQETIEDLTFYFAGHGEVRDNRLFLCARNTDRNSLAATSLSFSNLLVLIQDCRPIHANIIVDACQSGGVADDIATSLNPRTIGTLDSFGLSLLAACTRDQPAMEDDQGGFCTSALVECITGKTFVQDMTAHLDLMEVAKHVAVSVRERTGQSPVYWGVHLTGAARFCANPHVSDDSPVRRALGNSAGIGPISKEAKAQLFQLHGRASAGIDQAEVRDAMLRLRSEANPSPEQSLQLARQVSSSLSLACRNHPDPFRPTEVRSACIAYLVNDVSESEAVQQFVLQEMEGIAHEALGVIERTTESLAEHPYTLVGNTGAGELFFLPLRISKILAWTAFSLRVLGEAPPPYVLKLLDCLLDTYSLSCASISEDQAPLILIAADGFFGTAAHGRFETVLGLMFNDATNHHGVIADSRIPPSEIVEFLLRRKHGKFDGWRWLANPSMLLMSLLMCGIRYGLEEEFDVGLVDIDHCNINAFIPETYASFYLPRIEKGENRVFKIGHDFWQTSQLKEFWGEASLPLAANDAQVLLAGLCSLLYPDRTPWCLLPKPS
ncbi:caspase family protein [Arenimonas sp. MALMAid1274]|uniref:caspase family protein n=1 Tax=Arenimonas sp. MALMAid1274 TaxID=3411630 RepID=UPI003B9F9622